VPIPAATSHLSVLLTRAERRVARRVDVALRGSELTAEQWRVLSALVDGAGHPMSEIAGEAMVPAPTLTKLVDRLLDRALVRRGIDPADRRRVLVVLTDRGVELVDRLGTEVGHAEREVTSALGEPETAELMAILARLLERVP